MAIVNGVITGALLERNEGKTPKEVLTFETNEIYRSLNSVLNTNKAAIEAMAVLGVSSLAVLQNFEKVLPTITRYMETRNLMLSLEDAGVDINNLSTSLTNIIGASDSGIGIKNIVAAVTVFTTLDTEFSGILIEQIKGACASVKEVLTIAVNTVDKL